MDFAPFIVPPGQKVNLATDYDTDFTGTYDRKKRAKKDLEAGIERLTELQDVLYAQDRHALLIIFQAMDAAGKDSAIKHVMSGVNPQGCEVTSFKKPSAEELDHDYLWRAAKALPQRGRIGIFNRSYYEETLVVRVHPQILTGQKLPAELVTDNIWQERFEDINNFERYLTRNGVHILKFFLNVSKAAQTERFLDRINEPDKNWKFSNADMKERKFWDDYQHAFQETLTHTSTSWAPWYVIPADKKWFTRITVANIIINKLEALNLRYPVVNNEQREKLQAAKTVLESELNPSV